MDLSGQDLQKYFENILIYFQNFQPKSKWLILHDLSKSEKQSKYSKNAKSGSVGPVKILFLFVCLFLSPYKLCYIIKLTELYADMITI